MLRSQTFVSINMSEKLQTVDPLRRRLFGKLYGSMDVEHTALLCYCETYVKELHRVFELKQERDFFK